MKLLLGVLRDPSSGRAPRGFFQRLLKETAGGVTRDYLYQVAAGRIKEPSIEKLELLSSALGIPMDWWRLPVEAGPPRIGENGERTRSILAQLLALPPEQREEAFRQIEDVLGKLGEEAEGQQPAHGAGCADEGGPPVSSTWRAFPAMEGSFGPPTRICVLVISGLLIVLNSCAVRTPTAQVTPMATSRPTATPEPSPTITVLQPSTTPKPSATPRPTPERTATPRSTRCPWPDVWGEIPPDTYVPCGTVKEEQSFGEYTVRVHAENVPLGFGGFEILKDGQRIYAQAGSSHFQIGRFWVQTPQGKEEMLVPMGQDITGDGLPNLIMYYYSGGAYCCGGLDIFEIGETFAKIGNIPWGDYSPQVDDLDGNGNLEFTIHDSSFRFHMGWNRVSGGTADPLVILHFRDGGYHLALELMRRSAPTMEGLQELARPFCDDLEWDHLEMLRFWRATLDLIYTGHAELVEPFLEMVWPDDPGKRDECIATLQKYLPKSDYWPEIRELNPSWPWLEE